MENIGGNMQERNGHDDHHDQYTVHVEILQYKTSNVSSTSLEEEIRVYLLQGSSLTTDVTLSEQELPNTLRGHVASINISKEMGGTSDSKHVPTRKLELVCHVYQLETGGPDVEELQGVGDDPEGIPAATQWLLPSADFHGLWDSLIYDTDIKDQLLRFVSTALLFSDRGVDKNIISWNRVVLLHGPPGTGKTSLCRALAQKLSIRLGQRYTYGQLIEINSHSLFSKWFSESGKLVQKLFSKLQELVEDENALVCVLIDEVESLARSRSSSSASSDPGDAIRVVNALLTQLDQIKRHSNVLILTTSNISGTIDLAFVDRADIKHFVGLPSQAAIYQIYHSCIIELSKVGLIDDYDPCHLLTLRQLQITNMVENEATKLSLQLWNIARCSAGLSGRSLRRMPFLAYSQHVRRPPAKLPQFLDSLLIALEKHKADEDSIKQPTTQTAAAST
uniref:Pachytene checkpoint protein 2 homolog n=1 Tax=Hirondellea gigas TaxID=1518452 RepID=A0A2P2IE83_9CRUS